MPRKKKQDKTKRARKKVADRRATTGKDKPGKKKAPWRPPTGKELEKLREDWDHCT